MQIKNKTFYFLIILLSCIMMLSTCKRSTEPLFNTSNLQLQVLDVSCTEAWLSLIAKNVYFNKTLKLYQDDSLKLEKILTTEDSLLYVDGLWPNTSYQFKAEVYDGNKVLAKSATVSATTMDTTSHDFTWQTFEFGGQGGSSIFHDVAIIDENDIWAVGEIYTADDQYNAAHWDGKRWGLIKVPYVDDKGYVWITPIYSIFAFSSNDIWFEGGVHWNGSNFNSRKMNIDFPSHVNKMWGTSSTDLYVVGNNGLIAHYDGQQWQRIESGTDLPIQDIWGAFNKETGKYEILCVASNEYNNYGKKIIKIENKKATFIQDKGLPWSLRSIWFIPDRVYYVCGSGVFFNKSLHNHWKEVGKNIQFYSKYIKGFDFNDIFIVGAFGLVSHYNGLHWFQYLNKEWDAFNGAYYSLDYKRNLMVAVGEKLDQSINTKAIILIGRRK